MEMMKLSMSSNTNYGANRKYHISLKQDGKVFFFFNKFEDLAG